MALWRVSLWVLQFPCQYHSTVTYWPQFRDIVSPHRLERRPEFQIDCCSASHDIHRFLWNTKFLNCFHKSHLLVAIRSHMYPIYTFQLFSLQFVLTLLLHQVLCVGPATFLHISHFRACYKPGILTMAIWQHFMKFLTVAYSNLLPHLSLSSASCTKHPQSVFFPWCDISLKYNSAVWCLSVSVVSGYGLDDRAIGVRSPAQAKGFFL
jgi:hypothetical protein